MPLSYEQQHQFGANPAWSLVDDETGERVFTDNPMIAAQFGAPITQYMGPDIGAPSVPDQRLAMGEAPGQSTGLVTDAMSAPPPPPPPPDAPAMSEDPNALMSVDPSANMSMAGAEESQQPMAPQAPPPPPDPQQLKRDYAQTMLEFAVKASPVVRTPGRAGSPARMEPVKTEYRGDPEVANALAGGYQDLAQYQADTAGARMTVETERANARAEDARLQAALLESQQTDLQKTRDLQKTEFDRRLGAINTELNQVAQKKVNPNRFWDDASAGTTVGMAIALALGAFGSSVNGGPNQAMQILNNYIDRDTQRQQDAIRSAKEGVEMKRNAFQDWLDAGNDWKQTEATLKAIKLQHAEEILKYQASVESRQDIKLAYQDTIGQINKQKLDTLAELEKNIGASLTEKYVPEVKAIAAGSRLKTPDELAKDTKAVEYLADTAAKYGVDPKDLERRVEEYGKAIGTGTPSGITAMQIDVAYDDADNLMQEMAKKHGGELPGVGSLAGQVPDWLAGPDAARIRAAMRNVVSKQLRFESGAVASEEEKAALAEEMARIDELMTDEAMALQLYMDSRRRHNDTMRQRAAAFGGAPVLEAFQRNKRTIPLTAGALDPADPRSLDLQEPE